ncbi:RluA family pseudouridine synthase [Tistrella bauzanensis]|jgi:23S rRNA pseudouridine955/2504/2580 synthase|uniref:RluA family pseudouridine synthase n=1 Tax=Tistrella arctica TaxID=3133430 RepID=A0ABU9YNE7_9PROT
MTGSAQGTGGGHEPLHLDVSDDEDGQRLDRWLRRRLPGLGFAEAQRWSRTGQVRVDGKRAKPDLRLTAGATVRLPPLALPMLEAAAEGRVAQRATGAEDAAFLRSRVLVETDDLILIDKPSGLAVQGGSGTDRHLDGMLDGLARPGDAERPRLVHRLDRDTSGVLLLARNARAAAWATRAFRERTTTKIYWAVTLGVPSPQRGVIDLPLAKRQVERGGERMVAVDAGDDGQTAITEYEVMATGGPCALVALKPLTGRTHQLRAHLAAIGTPIVGDLKYGGAAVDLRRIGLPKRLHLHARRLSLTGPDGRRISAAAPLPPHMAASFARLGLDLGMGLDPEIDG